MSEKSTILVIEDDAELREEICENLELSGFKVVNAKDGQEGLQKTRKQEFNLILCDINMPRLKGDEAIPLIKKTKENENTPIIVLSGYLDMETVKSVRSYIVKAFTKPVNLGELTGYIKATLDVKK